ncbi:MAG TPA: TonB-dependent receptor [Saprospiraceae bacterium]|nr:TonB-dependent receptor [Saprospiraceae bacterium]
MLRVWIMASLWLAFIEMGFAEKNIYSITGKVTAPDGQPVPFASVTLHVRSDSMMVRATSCDENGNFVLDVEPQQEKDYFIQVSMTFYQPHFTKVLDLTPGRSELNLGTIVLHTRDQLLNAVEVSGKKPFVERRSDRYIMNVENSILAAGSSAFEILEKAPGVSIDMGDAIRMKGKSGVLVMIDGKPTPLSGSDLANYLKAMPSNSLDRIEIISTPPAKYDAAGNAGIIDIRLKKDQRFGTHGSVSSNYGQGVYPKAGIDMNANHRSRSFNVFGSAGYSYRKGLNKLDLYREFFENGQRTGAYDQRNFLLFPFRFQNYRLGVDWNLPNGKTTLGVMGTGGVKNFRPRGQNESDVEDDLGEKQSSFNTRNNSRDHWPNYSLNANIKHVFDSSGGELSADLDYARFWNATEQNFITSYRDLLGQPLHPDYYLYGDLKGKLQIRSAKVDYSRPLWKSGKFELGAKSSLVDADNDLQFFDKSSSVPVFDSSKSNHFIYREQIHAGYANLTWESPGIHWQIGLRAEQTRSKGRQQSNGRDFDRNYTNLFPTASMQLTISPQYDMGFSLSRRLDRPNYQQLNPFKFFLDPSTYREGNPYLNPQFSWVMEWNHSFRKNYQLSLSYTNTGGNITEVIGPVPGQERITVQTHQNLTRFENFSIGGSAHLNMTPRWSNQLQLESWVGRYTGSYAETQLRSGNLVFRISTNNQFQLGQGWNGELNFNLQTPEVYGFMKLETMWGLALGLQKQFWNNRANIKLSVSDIFWTNLPKAEIQYANYYERFDVKRETRVASLSVQYRFGKAKPSANARRSGGAEEEKRRAAAGQ